MAVKIERGLLNAMLMGLAFFCILTAFQTSSFYQSSILKDLDYGDLGFYSLSLVYVCFAIFNFIAPFVISRIGLRNCMALGASMYCCMMLSLIYIIPAVFLVASALNGLGAALLWTAQGTAITNCGNDATRGRNAGIFWGLLQCSLLAGAVASLIVIDPSETHIPTATAETLYIVLAGFCGIGIFVLLFTSHLGAPEPPQPIARSVVETFKMLGNKDMVLVCCLILYSGFELSFWQAQYPTIVGGKEDRLILPDEFKPRCISYLLLVMGAAEILGSVLLGRLSDRVGRWPIIVLAGVLQATAYLLIYLSLVKKTIAPNLPLAFICGFMLGFADSTYNTQVFSILGTLFSERSAPAFALNFTAKAIAAACAFYYSPHLDIQYQLLFLSIMLVLGSAGFVYVDYSHAQAVRKGYSNINAENRERPFQIESMA